MDRGADGVVEAEAGGDGGDAEGGAGGVEDEGAAVGAVAGDFGEEIWVEGGENVLFDKGAEEGVDFGGAEAAEVGEEEAFEGFGAEEAEGAEEDGGDEEEEVGAAEGVFFEDVITEKALGVVGQEGLVEVEDGEGHAARREGNGGLGISAKGKWGTVFPRANAGAKGDFGDLAGGG